jgi:uncharacterized protein YdhG (YjbR/CyaY superfamily)
MIQNKPGNVDEYIAQFPLETQAVLNEIRAIIRKAAPKATEIISYGMPAYKMIHVKVYFAAYKKHIGFYPTGKGIEAFKEEFGDFKWSKGAVQFLLDKPLPRKLITRIVTYKISIDQEYKTVKK